MTQCNAAMRLTIKLANKGNATAQFNLGTMYSNGKNVDQNVTEGIRYYKLAADQGHANAQFCIGSMYMFGDGVDENFDEAVRYYKLAADQKHCEAQLFLANLYLYKFGKLDVQNHKAEALRYYLKVLQNESNTQKHCEDAIDAITELASDKDFVVKYCLGCCKERKLKTCARCKVARFCSTECVQCSWKWHKPQCKMWEQKHECE